MHKLTDKELLEELSRRFKENKSLLQEQKKLMKQLELVNKKLKESEVLKTNFLSNIRNEINNPLSSILGLSEKMMTIDQSGILSIAKMIHSEAFNLDYQLRNIFAAAELEAGETAINVSNVNLAGFIKSIIDTFKHRALEKKLTINFFDEMIEDQTFFKTDSEKLHLVLSNLIGNAIEYSRESSGLEIKARIYEKFLDISIQDFGIGINKSDQIRIFDRFIQLNTGIMKNHKGHGLGLSVTKEIIELLKGTISVSSESNKGSLVTISIPEADTGNKEDIFTVDGNELLFEEVETF